MTGPESNVAHLAIHRGLQDPKGEEPGCWGTMSARRQERSAGNRNVGVAEASTHVPGTERGCSRGKSTVNWSGGESRHLGEQRMVVVSQDPSSFGITLLGETLLPHLHD